MINPINNYSGFQVNFIPAFRSQNTYSPGNVTSPIQEKKFVGQDILANYNKALINRQELKPVKVIRIPKDINQISGEKIYRSDGSLHSIIEKNQNQKIIYYINSHNTIPKIRVIDNNTGNLILNQDNYFKDENYNEYSGSTVTYNTKDGKSICTSYDENGRIESISHSFVDNKNESIYLTDIYNDNTLIQQDDTYWDKKNGYTYSKKTSFDNKKQVEDVLDEIIENKTQSSISKQTKFINGHPVSVRESKNSINYINNTDKDLLNDSDLKPSKRFEPDFDIKTCSGEKTYYSNGAIESNSFDYNGENIICYFEPDGRLSYVETPTKEIKIDCYDDIGNVEQEITEVIDNNRKKTTIYDDKKASFTVEYENGNNTKSIQIEDGKLII